MISQLGFPRLGAKADSTGTAAAIPLVLEEADRDGPVADHVEGVDDVMTLMHDLAVERRMILAAGLGVSEAAMAGRGETMQNRGS